MNAADSAIHSVLHGAILPFQPIERTLDVILDRGFIYVRQVFAGYRFSFFQFLYVRKSHEWREVEVKGWNCLAAVHLVLGSLK